MYLKKIQEGKVRVWDLGLGKLCLELNVRLVLALYSLWCVSYRLGRRGVQLAFHGSGLFNSGILNSGIWRSRLVWLAINFKSTQNPDQESLTWPELLINQLSFKSLSGLSGMMNYFNLNKMELNSIKITFTVRPSTVSPPQSNLNFNSWKVARSWSVLYLISLPQGTLVIYITLSSPLVGALAHIIMGNYEALPQLY